MVKQWQNELPDDDGTDKGDTIRENESLEDEWTDIGWSIF